jgi:uncharacterized membrane protein
VNVRIIGATVAAAGSVGLAMAAFELSFTRAVLLAPVMVISLGLLAALGILFGRAALESWRNVRRPWLAVGIAAAVVGVFVVLTLLGVNLPRE